jgi:tetratricopeptide (TPR) repeat protein
MADRYTYLPSTGIAIMLVWGIPCLIRREETRNIILFPMGIASIAILSFSTWQQCGYWKNSITLFDHALQVTNNNALAHNNLGLALIAEGKIEEAINHYNTAIRIAPDFVLPYNNKAVAYANLGHYQQAIEDLNKAIRIRPNYADAYYNRGLDYANLGNDQNAIEDFKETIIRQPDNALAYNNRGMLYLKQGNKEPGCGDAQKACALGTCKALEWAKGRGLCP